MPSASHPVLVSSLAAQARRRWAGSSMRGALTAHLERRPQQELHNSAHKLANVVGAFEVPPAVAEAVRGRVVLLVDDLWDSGWTATWARRLLRRGGRRPGAAVRAGRGRRVSRPQVSRRVRCPSAATKSEKIPSQPKPRIRSRLRTAGRPRRTPASRGRGSAGRSRPTIGAAQVERVGTGLGGFVDTAFEHRAPVRRAASSRPPGALRLRMLASS